MKYIEVKSIKLLLLCYLYQTFNKLNVYFKFLHFIHVHVC